MSHEELWIPVGPIWLWPFPVNCGVLSRDAVLACAMQGFSSPRKSFSHELLESVDDSSWHHVFTLTFCFNCLFSFPYVVHYYLWLFTVEDPEALYVLRLYIGVASTAFFVPPSMASLWYPKTKCRRTKLFILLEFTACGTCTSPTVATLVH